MEEENERGWGRQEVDTLLEGGTGQWEQFYRRKRGGRRRRRRLKSRRNRKRIERKWKSWCRPRLLNHQWQDFNPKVFPSIMWLNTRKHFTLIHSHSITVNAVGGVSAKISTALQPINGSYSASVRSCSSTSLTVISSCYKLHPRKMLLPTPGSFTTNLNFKVRIRSCK